MDWKTPEQWSRDAFLTSDCVFLSFTMAQSTLKFLGPCTAATDVEFVLALTSNSGLPFIILYDELLIP